MRLISSTLVLLLIAAPWHIAAGHRQPCSRTGARLFLVLLRQRTLPALSGQTHSARLRHRAAAGVLGTDVPVAVPVVGISAAVAGEGAASLARDSRRHESAPARRAAVRDLGGGDAAVLQLVDAAGVLRDSGAARVGADDRRLAATGSGFAGRIRDAQGRTHRLNCAGRDRRRWSLRRQCFCWRRARARRPTAISPIC